MTDPLYDSRNPNHGRIGGLREPSVQRSYPVSKSTLEELDRAIGIFGRATTDTNLDPSDRYDAIKFVRDYLFDLRGHFVSASQNSSDGGVESGHATASGSGPLPEPILTGDACSALEPPHQATEIVGRHQELKRAAGVTTGPSGAVNEELRYAHRLAEALWDKHWRDDAPHWTVQPDLIGTLTQIDNMCAGLSRTPRCGDPAQGVGNSGAWQPIETAPKDQDVIVWCNEGMDIARYSEREEDGVDSMGHDAGWWGVSQPMSPGRHMGNPEYFREAENQPWAWMPSLEPPYDDEGEPLFPRSPSLTSTQCASPVMQAAEKAARVVDGWSDTKKEYAERTMVVGRVTGNIHEGDQVAGMPGAICHACGLKDYPCVNPDCPNKASQLPSTEEK